ncbi:MAG: hypothetical protein M1837_002817 [Sclerophora amabilis]|nr:MAG: hypothetical protein M1837_002817 [Sclerophora amabilis]
MKKRLEEAHGAKIKLRDKKMAWATQEKKTWDAMDPEERETEKAKRKAPIDMFAPGLGAPIWTEMPDVYSKKVTAKDVASWSQSHSARSNRKSNETRFENDTSDCWRAQGSPTVFCQGDIVT